jgi:nucleotide-binding universal stress UspA family protein
MKTIVIAYDGSEGSEAVFTEVQNAGLPDQLKVHVVAVAELSPLLGMLSTAPSQHAEKADAMRRASALAEQGAARVRALFPKWELAPAGLAGSAARTIAERAREVAADLIFIGSHSHSVVGRFFLGSVSQKVASEAKCSVRICRPRAHSRAALRLLVAVDGSASSQAAVRSVAERTWRAGTAVAVVNVIEPPLRPGLSELPAEDAAEIRRQHEARLQWLETATIAAQRQLESVGLTAERHTLDGEPKSKLLEWAESWNADCLFIGASGLHHGGAETLGTVASALAVRAHCSVEIVRQRNGLANA